MGHHTDEFNRIMAAGAPPKKEKQQPIKEQIIKPRENMTPLQESISKCTIAGNVVRLPFERLENYNDVRKALMNAGAKYKNNTFIFPNDAQAFIDRLMDGDKVNIKKEFQFFATPAKVGQRVIDKIQFYTGAKVGEPSAGQGGLVDLLPNLNLDIHCIELMPENAAILKKKGYNVRCEDFLLNEYELFDIIIANPPFSKNQDIKHFMHMWKHLRTGGGQMAVIMSPHFTFGSEKESKNFRTFLDDNGGEFKESGTNIKTVLVTINK